MNKNIDLGNDALLRDRVTQYLSRESDRAIEVLELVRLPVGFSWLTFRLTVRGLTDNAELRPLILRLGPDYGLFAPYSALPQALSMQSLAGTAVPVPEVFWHGDDPAPFGAPFLFCELVAGSALLPWASSSLAPLEDATRVLLAGQFVDALAALHELDWSSRPMAKLVSGLTPENAAQQQLQLWKAEYERWAMRPYPLFEWGARWLHEHRPIAPRLSIVHGDYRTGNFLEVNGKITSILDWELAHIGDPHEDLGWASLPVYMGGTKLICRLAEPDRFFEHYQSRVSFELSMKSVAYYKAFSLLKLAATHMAAARCFEDGRFNDLRMPAMGSQILPVLRQLEKTIETI
jgi:aminoglycoside phosphotransferase (APT) family kinase protein